MAGLGKFMFEGLFLKSSLTPFSPLFLFLMQFSIPFPPSKRIVVCETGERQNNIFINLLTSNLMQGRINWYPGHMARATRKLEDTLHKCHVVVEVRDARVPSP